MPENFALYTAAYGELPPEQMQILAPGTTPTVLVPTAAQTDRGVTYVYAWSDLTVLVNEVPRVVLPTQLGEFVGYVRHLAGGISSGRIDRLIERIHRSKLVVGVELQPKRDHAGRAEDLIGRLCGGLAPLVFFEGAIYDSKMRLVLGPGGAFEEDSDVDM